ncbi:MAG: hypothetical protein M1835_002413, partial [Candelina submexicana]
MEHPSKRQKLSRVAGRPSSVGLGTRGNDDGNLTSAEAENDDDEALKKVTQAEASPPNHPLELRTLSVPPNTLTWSSERRRAVEGRHRRLHRRRDDSPNEQKHPAVTVPLLVKTLTIVDTVGISGTDPGVIVFPTTLTASSSQINGPTPGPTVPTLSSSLSLTGSTAPSYPFITASATESAGSSGNYTSPTGSADSSKPTSGTSPTTMLGSSPQIVLSSPPSTPLSPSPSGSSSGQSFFEQTPSNTTTASLATLSGTSSSNPQTTPAPDLPYLLRPVNGSTSTIVLSNNSTTFTATSIITLDSLTSNSSTSSASTDNTTSSSTLQSSSFSSNTTTTSASSVTSSTTPFSSTSTTASASSASTSGGIGVGAGGAGTATGSGTAPTGGSGSGNSSGGSSGPSTPAVVGGVVGGLAGL